MTLVETMSPAVTPSVDCVLNREWRSDTGTPGPELCSFSLAGPSQVKGERLLEVGEIGPSSAEFCVNIR